VDDVALFDEVQFPVSVTISNMEDKKI